MLRRPGHGLLWEVPAYLLGAFGGGYLVSQLSSNVHDRSPEAPMTGAFVLGPPAGVIGLIAGGISRRRDAAVPDSFLRHGLDRADRQAARAAALTRRAPGR